MADHVAWLGYYSRGVPVCAKCGKPIEPIGVNRKNVVRGWRHRAAEGGPADG